MLAVVAFLLRDGTRDVSSEKLDRRSEAALGVGAAVVVLSVLVAMLGKEWLQDLAPITLGFAGGAAAVLVSAFLARQSGQPEGGLGAPAALGLVGAAMWTLLAVEAREPYQLGAAAGAGIIGWMLSASGGGSWPSRTGIFAAVLILCDILGDRGAGGHSSQAGSVLGLLGVLAILIGVGIPRRPENAARNRLIGFLVAAAVIVLGAFLLATRHFFLNDLWILFAGGAGAGLVVAWVVSDDEAPPRSFGFVISVVMWLAVATLAFGLRKGYGISLATAGGLLAITLAGRSRAMLTLGPLVALVVYRVFRELHTDASRALDIGQHYALVGLAIGLALPLLALEWQRSRPRTLPTAIASALWISIYKMTIYASAVVLAAKGYVGVLAGLGYAPMAEGLRASKDVAALSLSTGLGVAMVVGYGWLTDKVDLARDEKVRAMVWVAVGIAVAMALITWLSRGKAEAVSGSEA